MPSHPDADAFLRGYLRTPADATARLVFADWLDETGTPSNTAWANYIRAKIDAARHEFGSLAALEFERQAARHGRQVQATLTVPASLVVAWPRSLLELLPAPNIAVRLADFDPAAAVPELIPESVARENFVFPLDVQDRAVLIATAAPRDRDTAHKLEFILDRTVVLFRAQPDDILAAINRCYGRAPVISFDSVLIDSAELPAFFAKFDRLNPSDEPDPSG